MERTKVKVYFSLSGHTFPLEYVTEKLGITPSNTYRKGDIILNRSTTQFRKETSWDKDTGYQNGFQTRNYLITKIKDRKHFNRSLSRLPINQY